MKCPNNFALNCTCNGVCNNVAITSGKRNDDITAADIQKAVSDLGGFKRERVKIIIQKKIKDQILDEFRTAYIEGSSETRYPIQNLFGIKLDILGGSFINNVILYDLFGSIYKRSARLGEYDAVYLIAENPKTNKIETQKYTRESFKVDPDKYKTNGLSFDIAFVDEASNL